MNFSQQAEKSDVLKWKHKSENLKWNAWVGLLSIRLILKWENNV